jgi:tRNA(Ile)-lysidine synthase
MEPLPASSPPDYRARLDARSHWTGPEGELRFEPVSTAAAAGVPESWLEAGLELRFRAGGEALLERAHSRTLKRWFQEGAIVPWMRSRIPLLFRADRLVAVADLWFADETHSGSAQQRYRVVWSSHPRLY